jgi:S1-C subfamily serine protease
VIRADVVVAPVYAASDSEIRITMPGGEQADAQLRVLDGYTGLALLETDTELPTTVELSDSIPQAGSWVISAAAWGTEQPAVSVGILGAAKRTLAGSNYPALLQCDLRTTETSSGAGVVDQVGKLIGVIVATDADDEGRGWSYAVPVSHVQRLLRVRDAERNPENVVILKRRRPVVGMILDGTAEGVTVSRVFADSPAEKAGIQVGDLVLAADGTKIRSVYQAVRPMLYKQPGDEMTFLLAREQQVLQVEVVLGGGIELPSAPLANLQQYIRPNLHVKKIAEGLYATRPPEEAPEVSLTDEGDRSERGPATAAERIELLVKAMERYQMAIVYLQNRVQEEEQRRQETDEQIRQLKLQLQQLQQQQIKE